MDETNRVYLTKEAIRQAFLRQIEQRDVSRVKVSDVLVDARVSKATFYRYYKDVYDLLADCFATYLEVEDEIEKAAAGNHLVDQQNRLTVLGMDRVKKYPRLFLMCHRCSYGPFAVEFAEKSIARSVDAAALFIRQQGITSDTCLIDIDELAVLCVDLSTAICIRWVNDGCRKDPGDIAELSSLCILRFVDSMRIEGGVEEA